MLCRLCLTDSDGCVEIFGEEGRKHRIAMVLNEFFWFQIVETDAISTVVCLKCWYQTSTFQAFHSNIRIAQQRFFKHSKCLAINTTSNSRPVDIKPPKTFADEELPAIQPSSSVSERDGVVVKPLVQQRRPRPTTAVSSEQQSADEAEYLGHANCDVSYSEVDNRAENGGDAADMFPANDDDVGDDDDDDYDQDEDDDESTGDDEDEDLPILYRNKAKLAADHVKAELNDSGGKEFDSIHNRTEVPRLQCNICGMWLREKRLKKHLKRHNTDLESRCTLCGKQLQNKNSLRNHMRNVHDNRKHQCAVCGKMFSKPLSLREHMTLHNGRDLYTCPYCPKTFKSSGNMHSHRKKFHFDDWSRDRGKRLVKCNYR